MLRQVLRPITYNMPHLYNSYNFICNNTAPKIPKKLTYKSHTPSAGSDKNKIFLKSNVGFQFFYGLYSHIYNDNTYLFNHVTN